MKILVDFVEMMAFATGLSPVPREYIEEAVRRVLVNEEEIERNSDGTPKLFSIYQLATVIESASVMKN